MAGALAGLRPAGGCRDDMPNGNLGYPTTTEYPSGRLFVIHYYGEYHDCVTCVIGSYVDPT